MARTTIGPPELALVMEYDGGRLELVCNKFAESLSDFRRFWREFFAPKFFLDILGNFRTQGGAVGGWRALNPAYAAWKRSVVGNKPILRFSDAMMNSFRLGDRNNLVRITKSDVELGSRMARVTYHNKGMGRVPKRQIIFIGPKRTYQPLLNEFLTEEMRFAGFPNVKVRGGRVA